MFTSADGEAALAAEGQRAAEHCTQAPTGRIDTLLVPYRVPSTECRGVQVGLHSGG
jgi:hypothetical protein